VPGAEPTELAVPLEGAMLVWQPIREATDGSLLVVAHHPRPRVANGILRLDAGAEMLRIVRLDDDGERGVRMPMISGVTPAGDVAFVYNPQLLARWPVAGEHPIFWTLDVGTGRVTPADWLDLDAGEGGSTVTAPADPPERGVASSLAFPAGPQTFSPDGSRWVGAFQRVDSAERLLALVDTDSGAVLSTIAEQPDDGLRFMPLDPQFAADGTVLLQVGSGRVALVHFGAA